MKVLMCRPDFFDIEYEINSWMHLNNKVDRKKAIFQWEALYNKYLEFGVEVNLITPEEGLPDMVFTANSGIVKDNIFISGNFSVKERKNEEKHFKKWFSDHGYKVLSQDYYQSGEGDALMYKDNLYLGWGFRSDLKSHMQIADFLNINVISLKLIDSYFYDFDTAFLPLGDKGFMYYPPALDKNSLKVLQNTENGIIMTKIQAENFLGNSVLIGDKLIVGYLDDDLKRSLADYAIEPIYMDMSEFKKSGGGIKCCTLYLER